MTEKVLNAVNQHNMIKAGDTIAVCLSGGRDSMALFHFLYENRLKLEINLIALHVNHGLREESRQEQVFVQQYCEQRGIECVVYIADMNNKEKPQGMSTEVWARDLRYNFFFEQAEKYGAKLATAHTLSDRVETVLFNLTRGTSLKGAIGIPPVRDNIIRPLIDCTRADIESYCADNNIPYVNDQTNFQDIYSRNKIRLNVIPQLEKINISVEKAVGNFAQDSDEIYDFLNEQSELLYRNALGLGGLDTALLAAAHPAVTKNLLRNSLDRLGCLSKDNINGIYAALTKDSFKRQLSAQTFCRIKNGRLAFYTPKQEKDNTENQQVEVKFDEITQFIHFNGIFSIISQKEYKNLTKNRKNHLTYRLNYDTIKGVPVLRTRKTGDSFTFVGRNVTKSLKKLFIEDKVPRDFRDSIAVLTDETGAVLWLQDYGTNKPYVPDENTEKILLITQL